MYSTDYCNKALDALFGDGRAASTSAIVYVALFTTLPPSRDAAGVEVAAAEYARVAVANTTANFPNAANRAKAIAAAVEWATATSNWGTVVGWGLFTAATGGIRILHEPVATPGAVTPGNTARFPANTLVLRAA